MSTPCCRQISFFYFSRSLLLISSALSMHFESAVAQVAQIANRDSEKLWNQEGYKSNAHVIDLTFTSQEVLDGDLLFLRFKGKVPHVGVCPRLFLDSCPPLHLDSIFYSDINIALDKSITASDGEFITLLRVPLFVDRGGDENKFAIRVFNESRESDQDPPLHVFNVVGTAMSQEIDRRIFRAADPVPGGGTITSFQCLRMMVSDADKLRPLIEELHPKSNIISYFQFAIDVHDMVIKPDRDPATVSKELFRMANQLPDGLREYVLTMLPNFIKAESAEYRSRQLKKRMKRPSITS